MICPYNKKDEFSYQRHCTSEHWQTNKQKYQAFFQQIYFKCKTIMKQKEQILKHNPGSTFGHTTWEGIGKFYLLREVGVL